MDKRIEERIRCILCNTPIEKIAGFCAVNFTFISDVKRRTDHDYWVNLLVEKLETAHPAIKNYFIDSFAEDSLRVCDNCREFMLKGFYLDGYYACCKECAIEHYKWRGLTESDLEEDLSHADEDGCDTYYTEWE